MEEAYNLWALLYYDLGIRYPQDDIAQASSNEPFVFWAADLSILKAQRVSTAIRAGGHLRYPVGRKDCLYRKKRQYACAHGVALCVALPSKSTQIWNTGGSIAARPSHTLLRSVCRSQHDARRNWRRNRRERGRVHPPPSPAAQLSDSKGGKLAIVHHQSRRTHNYIRRNYKGALRWLKTIITI